MQSQTSFWLDDLNFGYFTKDQVKRWINNAHKEAQKLLVQAGENYFIECVQTTMVVNQAEYVLPVDFVKLHRLETILTGTPPNETKLPVAPITLNQQDLVPTFTGQPQFYCFKKNRLMLFPTPDTPLLLRLTYTPLVDDMINDTDVPEIPESYHEFLAVLATIDGFLKDNRDPSAMLSKREYYEKMLKSDADERNQDAPRSVVQLGYGLDYGTWFW